MSKSYPLTANHRPNFYSIFHIFLIRIRRKRSAITSLQERSIEKQSVCILCFESEHRQTPLLAPIRICITVQPYRLTHAKYWKFQYIEGQRRFYRPFIENGKARRLYSIQPASSQYRHIAILRIGGVRTKQKRRQPQSLQQVSSLHPSDQKPQALDQNRIN